MCLLTWYWLATNFRNAKLFVVTTIIDTQAITIAGVNMHSNSCQIFNKVVKMFSWRTLYLCYIGNTSRLVVNTSRSLYRKANWTEPSAENNSIVLKWTKYQSMTWTTIHMNKW